MEVQHQHQPWLLQPFYLTIFAVLMVLLMWLVLLRRRRRRAFLQLGGDPLRAHCWQATQFPNRPAYCNSCTRICLSGSYCVSCGLCTCTENDCIKLASSRKICKPLATGTGCGDSTQHFWVKGNLPLYSQCFKCLNPCGNLPKLADFRCVWCQQTAHEDCVEEMDVETGTCDLGLHHRSIIPPTSVTLSLEGWRGRRRLVVKGITPPVSDEWCPLIVMANPSSGGKDGQAVISAFRKLLNPIQVLDLSEFSPECGLEICRHLVNHTCRVLVCGGDGTVGWVFAAIDQANLPRPPHVAILPLGTGNDLARVLGWGSGYEGEEVEDILVDVEHAELALLDRWCVRVEQQRYLGLGRGAREVKMNNYLGIGCGAGVALNFHRQRESRPKLFQNRIINKAWYLGFGARDVLEQSCKNLHKKIQLFLDGVELKLPQLEGVVVLNINSWSSGCTMWNTESESQEDNFGLSCVDDNVLEVVGLYSSLHVGRIQVSMADPVRLGQAKEVKVVVLQNVPVQVDGEPWQQGPAFIHVTHHKQAHVLRKRTD